MKTHRNSICRNISKPLLRFALLSGVILLGLGESGNAVQPVTAGVAAAINQDLDANVGGVVSFIDGASPSGVGTDGRVHVVLDLGSVKSV